MKVVENLSALDLKAGRENAVKPQESVGIVKLQIHSIMPYDNKKASMPKMMAGGKKAKPAMVVKPGSKKMGSKKSC
jgi:hypothetical protein